MLSGIIKHKLMVQFLCVLRSYELNKEVDRSHREIKQALTCEYCPWCRC